MSGPSSRSGTSSTSRRTAVAPTGTSSSATATTDQDNRLARSRPRDARTALKRCARLAPTSGEAGAAFLALTAGHCRAEPDGVDRRHVDQRAETGREVRMCLAEDVRERGAVRAAVVEAEVHRCAAGLVVGDPVRLGHIAEVVESVVEVVRVRVAGADHVGVIRVEADPSGPAPEDGP